MVVVLTSEHIVIDRIKVEVSRPIPDEEIVRQLMQSIPEVGLLQPVVLHRAGTGLGVKLVFGRNRLEACKRLKHTSLLARVANGNTDEIKRWCEQAALAENLIRRVSTRPADLKDHRVISMMDRKRAAR